MARLEPSGHDTTDMTAMNLPRATDGETPAGVADDEPVMLFYAPHNAHEEMADALGAELVESVRGGPVERIREARRLDVGDRPVITEGGQPQFQAAWMKIVGNCGPVIHLSADASLVHMHNSVPDYRRIDRWAHRWAHRYVDGVLAISPRLAAMAHVLDIPVKLIHPFTEDWKYDRLVDLEPGGGGRNVLAVGHEKPANNFQMLDAISRHVDADVSFDVVGPGTDELSFEADNVTGHGFAEKDAFVDFFDDADAFILPSPFQAYAVVVAEAMHAGVPPIITDYVGTAAYVNKIHPRLVQEKDAADLGETVDWLLGLPEEDQRELGERSREMGSFLTRERGIETFLEGYRQLMDRIRDGG